MANQRNRPMDPMELAKQGNMSTVVPSEPEVPAVSAAPEVELDESDLEPPKPAPPAPKIQRFVVAEEKLVRLDNGKHATQLRKGSIVSAESHNMTELADQGVKLEPAPDSVA
jgi:hypothetical protein